MSHPTYSIVFKGPKKDWLKEQIGLARICAHEVPLDRAQFVFVSAQSIRKLPRQGPVTAIIPSQNELTQAEQDEVESALMEGRAQIAVSCLDRNIRSKLMRWFPPITSCSEIPKSVAV
jgi:hypothetical protein